MRTDTNFLEETLISFAQIFSRELVKELKRTNFHLTRSIEQPFSTRSLNNESDRPERRLIAVPDWNKHHPNPSIGGLRWLIFHAKENGFDRVIRRTGRRVYIDEQEFFAWVDSCKTR